MANSNSSSSGGGVGFASLLTLLFIGLKLGHVIDWSWWWVLSPLWGTVVVALAIGLIYAGIVAVVKK